MRKILTLTILATMVLVNGAWAAPYTTAVANDVFSGSVNGIPTPNDATGEVEIYHAVNLLMGTGYTNNAQLDSMQVTGDKSTWQDLGGGGYAFIGIGAGNSNSLKVYNASTPGTKIDVLGTGFSGNGLVGDGSISNPFYGTGTVFSPGTNFGFALKGNGPFSLTSWDSNPANNSDGMDHLMAYNLSSLAGTQIHIFDPNTNTEQLVTLRNPYLLAFEDLSLASNGAFSDEDYNDYIGLVDGVAPVPEPSTWALLGVGLVGMAFFAARRNIISLS